jgi:hypothetical protein
MAKRDAPKQFDHEMVVRNFLDDADLVGLPIDPSVRGNLLGWLGYQVAPNGAIISRNIEIKYKIGQDTTNLWTDTYTTDWEKRCEEREATTAVADVDDTADSGTSESPEGN